MKLIIDVGCNKLQGFIKLESLENITNEDQKIFVEANPECWDFLEKNISSIPNSLFIKKALDTQTREVQLTTRADNKTDMAATILGQEFIEKSLNRWNIKVKDYQQYTISTVTLKELLSLHQNSKYDSIILKLDIEGMEYSVIQQILDDNINVDKIYCEFHIHTPEENSLKAKLIEGLKDKGIQILDWD